MALKIKVRIEGADDVIRALNKLPADAQTEMKREAKDIATSLADWIKAAGRTLGRQDARAASTVKEGNAGFWPQITASNTGRAKGLLFGSEFGMTRKSGWYARRRYFDSFGRQFRPHVGQGSYWFFKTAEERQPWVQREWQGAADGVVQKWSA
jgi:hypothetical protein